jgi:hypothetical protein
VRLPAVLVLMGCRLWAADASLDAIHALLQPMRDSEPMKARGATPALTTVKHQLRDWIEPRLQMIRWDGWQVRWTPDPAVLQDQLNHELGRADLICNPGPSCTNPLGYLGQVTLQMSAGSLVVTTGVGIQVCGYDESAYAYEWQEGKWRRFWQSAQDNYEEAKYFPQRLRDVQISAGDFSPGGDKTARLILTLGNNPWCSSVWHPVYYRVWQTKETYGEPRLLLDGNEMADVLYEVHGSASPTEVLMEYTIIGIDAMRIPEIRHYILRNDNLERADPVALGPRDFTALWFTEPFSEMARWTEPGRRSKLEQRLANNKHQLEEPLRPSRHCTQHPDLWQVRAGDSYFLVRGRPPYRFTMMDVAGRPWPDCTEEDPAVDEIRTLFPAR